MEQQEVRELQTEVAVIKRDINQFGVLFTKLDVTIEKIGDVSNNISRLLAVHEERLDVLNSMDKELESKLMRQRDEISADIKELHSRITTNNREVCDAIKNMESNIKTHIDNEHLKQQAELEKISNKVNTLEKWRWYLVGAAVVAAWLFSQVDLSTIIK